jgi:photosystem II stability/assembly factor-like uncharacterized protein
MPSGASAIVGKLVLQESGFTPSSQSTWWAVMEPTVTARSFVFRTDNSGRTWRDVSPTSGVLESTYFLGSRVGWAIGQVATGSPAPVYETLNAGKSWRKIGSVPVPCTLDFVDKVRAWCTLLPAAAGSEGVELYRTSDGGGSWSLVSDTSLVAASSAPGTLPGGCDKALTFTSAEVGWASYACNGGTAPLYETTDGGSTWQPLPPPKPLTSAQWEYGESLGVPTVRGSDIALSVHFGRHGETQIATSTDAGATWVLHGVPGPARRWNVDVVDQSRWVMSNGKSILSTDDAGASWRAPKGKVTLADKTAFPLELRFISAAVGWVVPGPNGGALSWTTDGAARWHQIHLPVHP